MVILLKAIYRFPSKFQCLSLQKQKSNPETHMETQGLQIIKAIRSRKNNAEGTTISALQLHYRRQGNKINSTGPTNRHTNGAESSSQRQPTRQPSSNVDIGAKNIHWRKAFSTNGGEKIRGKLQPHLPLGKNIN